MNVAVVNGDLELEREGPLEGIEGDLEEEEEEEEDEEDEDEEEGETISPNQSLVLSDDDDGVGDGKTRTLLFEIARIHACGGFITAEKSRIPNIPKFDIVNVPP